MGRNMKPFFISLLVFFHISFDVAARDLPSPVDYFGPPDHRNFSISPSGRYLASVRDLPMDQIDYDNTQTENDRRIRLNLVNQGAGDQINIYDFHKGEFVKSLNIQNQSVYWLHWASDERLLASISATYDLNFGRRYTFQLPAARTVSMTPLADTEPVVLFANDRALFRQNLFLSNIADPLADDPDHVLMSAFRRGDLDLWRVNITNGEAKRIATGTAYTFGWIADGRGQAAFRLDRNVKGTTMTVYAQQENRRWRKVISTPLNEEGYGQSFWPLARGARNGDMYVLTSPPEQERASVAIYNLATGQLSPPVMEHETFDLSGGLIDPHTGEYFGAWYVDDRYKTIFLDDALQKHMDGINAFFSDDANIKLVAASRDFRRLLLEVTSPTIPGEIYAYDRIEQQIEPVFDTRSKLGGSHLSEVEMLTVTARDGKEFRAYLTHPAQSGRDQPAPLVVIPHGGPAARDSYGFDPMAQFLASRGYRVLQPNFRGSSGYGVAFEESGHREWGGKMQTDVMDAFHQVRDSGIVKDDKACIAGSSYGGYVALYAAMTTPDDFECAISIAGVTDLIDILKYERQGDRESYELAIKKIGDPREERDKLIARSPARNADKITLPLLLIHGRQDNVVPYDQFTKLTDALDEAGVDYSSYVVNDGHSFSRLASTVQSMRRIERFLAEHLGGDIGY